MKFEYKVDFDGVRCPFQDGFFLGVEGTSLLLEICTLFVGGFHLEVGIFFDVGVQTLTLTLLRL